MGREFVGIFDEWVHTYDDSVSGKDEEYKDVFVKYNEILQAVADAAVGPVVEFGVGTGNLTEKLLGRGLEVVGIEPNQAMREVVAEKLKDLTVTDGDFLEFDAGVMPQSFVSSYAFHHLTDAEKARAFQIYAEQLPAGGKVVFADTLFESEDAKKEIIAFEQARGHANLVEDLNREYLLFPIPLTKTVVFAPEYVYRYAVGNADQSINPSTFANRYAHHDRVIRRMLNYYKENLPTMGAGQQRYMKSLFERHLLQSHYLLSLVWDPDRSRGLKRARDFDAFLRNLDPGMWKACGKRYLAVFVARKKGFDPSRIRKPVSIDDGGRTFRALRIRGCRKIIHTLKESKLAVSLRRSEKVRSMYQKARGDR